MDFLLHPVLYSIQEKTSTVHFQRHSPLFPHLLITQEGRTAEKAEELPEIPTTLPTPNPPLHQYPTHFPSHNLLPFQYLPTITLPLFCHPHQITLQTSKNGRAAKIPKSPLWLGAPFCCPWEEKSCGASKSQWTFHTTRGLSCFLYAHIGMNCAPGDDFQGQKSPTPEKSPSNFPPGNLLKMDGSASLRPVRLRPCPYAGSSSCRVWVYQCRVGSKCSMGGLAWAFGNNICTRSLVSQGPSSSCNTMGGLSFSFSFFFFFWALFSFRPCALDMICVLMWCSDFYVFCVCVCLCMQVRRALDISWPLPLSVLANLIWISGNYFLFVFGTETESLFGVSLNAIQNTKQFLQLNMLHSPQFLFFWIDFFAGPQACSLRFSPLFFPHLLLSLFFTWSEDSCRTKNRFIYSFLHPLFSFSFYFCGNQWGTETPRPSTCWLFFAFSHFFFYFSFYLYRKWAPGDHW